MAIGKVCRYFLSSRSLFGFLCAATIVLSGTPPHMAAQAERPNFLIFLTDDQGYGDVGCYGATDFRTPNMDSLAAAGARFTNWYSNAPVCSASRASLLTGRYPHRAGAPGIFSSGRNAPGMPIDEVTLAEILRSAGYRTGLVGKWHLGGAPEQRPNRQGFDDFFGFHSGCIDNYSHIYYWGQAGAGGRVPFHDLWRNDTEIWENGQYFSELVTREAVRFIAENHSRPFFLYVAYNLPHYPNHAPPRYYERFSHITDSQRKSQAVTVAAVDDSMGEIMSELRRTGLIERTVIFFTSDNGPSAEKRNLLDDSDQTYHGGSAGPFRGYKGGLFEGGIRMPALMSWAGKIPKRQVITNLGITMDIFPTFLNLAGCRLPAGRTIDGRDIYEMAARGGESPHAHEPIFWAYGDQRAVRRDNWKLLLNARLNFDDKVDDRIFLCDLAADPGERMNLAVENPQLVRELIQLIEAWEKDVMGRKN
ncbi:MAG TPA: sulfatase-like hydrolase/transferase [Acidobacteriota bacterium]|nr:sulfatase-like hydrolase/transferase [Acidobacteriota bacterium]